MAVLLLILLLPVVRSECYWNNRCVYGYFGSKTPYDDVRGDIRDVPPLNECEPISVWFMARHGTRHPGSDDIETMKHIMIIKEDIITSHVEGRGELCAQDISNLKKWQWNHTLDTTASALTDEGYQELLELGARFHEKFFPLLETLEDYHFRPSSEQRTKMSAKAFTEGLGLDTWIFNVTDAEDKDDVIRPYKHCDRRGEEILKGPHIQNEMNKYYATKEFKEMLKRIQNRISYNQELTPQNATGLYDLCRYYRAYSTTRSSPWCALFSNEELEIMEYVEDVRHYYRNGYGGGPINAKLGEMALQDLLNTFESANVSKSFTGYFTHDTMLEMVYSALGLYKDYPEITGLERVKSRHWRSSLFSPFAANFVAVLNRCNTTETESLKVQFFVNEIEVHLCKERACSLEDFKTKFTEFRNSNLEFCNSTRNSST